MNTKAFIIYNVNCGLNAYGSHNQKGIYVKAFSSSWKMSFLHGLQFVRENFYSALYKLRHIKIIGISPIVEVERYARDSVKFTSIFKNYFYF
jgi:hypothetical protein